MFEHLRQALLLFIVLLLSIALHEFGHAKMADLLGDPLPRSQGRVTLNPVAHWDLLGTIIIPGIMILLPVFTGSSLPFALIGWGKPVMISLPNRKTRVRDDILITLAGPAMNLLIAFVVVLVAGLAVRFGTPPTEAADIAFRERIADFAANIILLNVFLLAFNLVPIPPLDGSHILRHLTRMKDETYLWLSRNSLWILLVLINIPVGGKTLMMWLATPFLYAAGGPLLWLFGVLSGSR